MLSETILTKAKILMKLLFLRYFSPEYFNHATIKPNKRFWLARRCARPLILPAGGLPAADLRPSSVRARRLRPALACPTAHVSHSAGQTNSPSDYYIYIDYLCTLLNLLASAKRLLM